MRTRSRDDFFSQVVISGLLLVVLLLIALPLWRVVATSFTPLDLYLREGVPLLLPPWSWSATAYQQLLGQSSFLRAAVNSLVITVGGTAISVLLTVPMAYALSTRTLPFRNVLTTLILFTFLFHPGLVPQYLLVNTLGLNNTYFAVILPPAVSVYNTLVMKTFFEGIPDALKEAARIDGANDVQVLWSIVLPLSTPILLTIGMFYAVFFWNEFFTPILYLNDARLQPLPVLLRNILTSASVSENIEANAYSAASVDSLKSASVLLTMLPMLILYPWIQRHFTRGALVGSVKSKKMLPRRMRRR